MPPEASRKVGLLCKFPATRIAAGCSLTEKNAGMLGGMRVAMTILVALLVFDFVEAADIPVP